MGRFETTVDFYHFREPYPPEFFSTVAARLALKPQTKLLDVACGPGNLALGFAPLVGACTALDIEPEMLRAASSAAAAANLKITFIEQPIEHLSSGSFDFITIGRALHWLPREATLAVFERILTPAGHIAICGSISNDSPATPWFAKFREVRKAWSTDPDESRYQVDLNQWFEPSCFRKCDDILVTHRHRISIAELVGRGLSYSTNSPAALGARRPQFEAAIESAVAPYATDGILDEELLVKATVFTRSA